MKKRTGLDRAILGFVVLDIILLAAFLVLHISDIRVNGGEDTPVSVPIVTDAQAPEDSALKPGEAEKIVGNADSSGRPAQMTLTFGDEQVDADLAVGSFRQRGGPDFSLYIDSTRYKLSENEGRCYVAASGNAGAKCYLELAFLPNSDAASVASTLLSSYGAVTVNPAEKTEAFGGYSAIRVTGSSAETDLEACVVSVNGGSLTVVLCVPGMQSADADLLRSSLDSLIVQ